MRRNKLALFFTVGLVLCILLSACTIEINVSPKDTKPDEPRTPVEQVQPTTVPPTPTDVPPIPTEIPPTAIPPTPTEIPPSPTPMPVVTLGVVDMGDGFWLTYDTALWRINSDRGYNFLQSKNYNGCNFQYQFGHGMDPNTFEANMSPKTFGGKEIKVTRWTRISNGDLILLAFYYGSEYFSVEGPKAETLPPECEAQAYDVVTLSAEKGFKP